MKEIGEDRQIRRVIHIEITFPRFDPPPPPTTPPRKKKETTYTEVKVILRHLLDGDEFFKAREGRRDSDFCDISLS